MRANPTLGLARAVANIPIRTAKWGIQSDDDVPDEIEQFIKDQIDYIWPGLMQYILDARDYGFQAFEKVYGYEDGRYVLRKLKALIPDKTLVQVDKETGAFRGLKQEGVVLPETNVFWYTYQGDPGNYYGRSQFENSRATAWKMWQEITSKALFYVGKIAGVLPVVHYPVGESLDASGSTQSNFDIATAILAKLGSGHGIATPNELPPWAQDLARSGIDPTALMSWRVSFLETKGQHATGLTTMLRYWDSCLMRSWLVPERAAVEGQYGTKAEASVHQDLSLSLAELVFEDILRHVNWYIVNPLLLINFGPQYEDKVKVIMSGLTATAKAFLQKVLAQVLSAPSNIDLLQLWLDIDVVLDSLGVPKAQENVNELEIEPRPPSNFPPAGSEEDDGRSPIERQAASIQSIFSRLGLL